VCGLEEACKISGETLATFFLHFSCGILLVIIITAILTILTQQQLLWNNDSKIVPSSKILKLKAQCFFFFFTRFQEMDRNSLLLLGSVHSQTSLSLCVKETSSSTPVGYLRHHSHTSLCVRRQNIFTRQQPLSSTAKPEWKLYLQLHHEISWEEKNKRVVTLEDYCSRNQEQKSYKSSTIFFFFSFFLMQTHARATTQSCSLVQTWKQVPNTDLQPQNFFKLQGQNMKIGRERTRSDKCLYQNFKSILHALDP